MALTKTESTKAAPKRSRKKKTPKSAPAPAWKHSIPFPDHMVSRDWDSVKDLNAELKAAVWKNRALDPEGLYRSNVAGTWHSKDNLLETSGDAGLRLREMFAQAFGQWGKLHGMSLDDGVRLKMGAWAMVYSDRGYAAVHTHPNCHVSGVYYVDDTTEAKEQIMATGVPVRAGAIEFLPHYPREHQVPFLKLNRNFIVDFKPGRMLVFPSHLQHYVHPIVGTGERISVACNGTFQPPVPTKDTSP